MMIGNTDRGWACMGLNSTQIEEIVVTEIHTVS